jgi:hypothetical protein
MRSLRLWRMAVVFMLAGGTELVAQQALEIDPSVQFVVTGGYWTVDGRDGVYRVVVQQGGWEHVASHVIVQWLARDEDVFGYKVLESIALIDPQVDGPWSFRAPKLKRQEVGVNVMLRGTHTHALSEGEFVFAVGTPGQVRTVNRGM